MKTKYRLLNKKEEEATIIKILDTLLDPSLPYSGKHRHEQWEKGWGENLKSGDLKPKYFGKYPVNRLNGKFVMGLSKNYEQEMLYKIVDSVGRKYLNKCDVITELGCGTGHNLKRLSNINKKALLLGGDWTKSSNKLVSSLGERYRGFHFDFFNPPPTMEIDTSDIKEGVITVAALEQTGTNYKKFVSFLLKSKPSVVVHIEPMPEYLDKTKLIDYLSIKYMEKRKYLSGYRDYIEKLEKEGKVKILESRRSGIGSLYIDGYSILVWKPI